MVVDQVLPVRPGGRIGGGERASALSLFNPAVEKKSDSHALPAELESGKLPEQ